MEGAAAEIMSSGDPASVLLARGFEAVDVPTPGIATPLYFASPD